MEVIMMIERELKTLFGKRATLQKIMKINQSEMSGLMSKIEEFEKSLKILEESRRG